jgi:hypothetical protein
MTKKIFKLAYSAINELQKRSFSYFHFRFGAQVPHGDGLARAYQVSSGRIDCYRRDTGLGRPPFSNIN